MKSYLFLGAVIALALVAVTFAFAPAAQAHRGLYNTPSGAPPAQHPAFQVGGSFPLDPLRTGTIHMDDGFGYHWTDTGNCQAFSGTITGAYPSGSSSGNCKLISKGNVTSYWKAVNNQPDNCTNYSDWFEYFGSGWTTQSGNWNSYCNGQIINSGTWSGVVGKGP